MGRYFINKGSAHAWLTLACSVMLSASLHAEEAPKPSSTTPTRHEIWVPTKDLKEVLKKHPNAVLLDRAQYEALVRDAERLSPSEEKLPPISAVVEEVRVSARVAADATAATLTYEYHLRNLREGWCELTLPYSLTSEKLPRIGGVQSLIDLKAEKPLMVAPEPSAWRTKIATRGEGRHVLSLVFSVPVNSLDTVFSLSGFSPLDQEGGGGRKSGPSSLVAPLPSVRLELPSGMSPSWRGRKLADGAWEVIPTNSLSSHLEGGEQRSIHKFNVRWSGDHASSGGMQPTAQVTTLYRVTADKVIAASAIRWSGSQPPPNGRLTLLFPREARVLFSTPRSLGMDDQPTVSEGKMEFDVSASRTSRGQILVLLELPIELTPGVVREVSLPSPSIEGIQGVQSLCAFLVDPDVRLRLGDFGKLAQTLRPDDVRALKEAIPTGTESRAQILPTPEFAGEIPAHPNFMAGFRFDAMSANAVIQAEMVPDRFSVDADALVEVSSHEVNVVRTLVFHGEAGSTSRAVVTLPEAEVFLEVPVNSGEAAIWKQVGRDIEVTWPKGLATGGKTSLTVRTRRDIAPKAADGSATDKVAIASIPVSGASRVSGYAALKFDESWKVNVTESTGLETRDARATPVRGRMAWFGLKDWKLGFDLSRRAPVHDATVTAYALPRAKQVEIEGQITLSVTGAPLRKFEVKLPPAIAPLLRVTSPLVGEQLLDLNTGVWTFILGRELMGTGNVRFRMSLPAENATAEPGSTEGTLTAVLPDITLPGARRTAGRWVVEANTDTELAFTTRGVQPLDARRPPAVEGYAPQHRVIAAFSHGGGEHEIRLTATRHDPATLAGMVLIHLRMTSVLGEDGSARHEAVFTLRHNGRQFATIRLPEGAGLLSTVVDGKAVRPVKAGTNEVRLPLASRIGDTAPVEVKVMYDTPSGSWGGSGRLGLTPPTLGTEVPVMETA
ncbi:MAG TPA: hypothetical protein VLE43_17785 [Candidatus Saccharimonadia bacterium]|nr:hypothetical protein [Candidatus Saccharimonadia bacterium]